MKYDVVYCNVYVIDRNLNGEFKVIPLHLIGEVQV
jgi:hypothetical protein